MSAIQIAIQITDLLTIKQITVTWILDYTNPFSDPYCIYFLNIFTT